MGRVEISSDGKNRIVSWGRSRGKRKEVSLTVVDEQRSEPRIYSEESMQLVLYNNGELSIDIRNGRYDLAGFTLGSIKTLERVLEILQARKTNSQLREIETPY